MAAPLFLLLLLMQVGPDPSTGTIPDTPEELRNRPPRETVESAPVRDSRLSRCLRLAGTRPEAALDSAQRWREGADSESELAQSAHCAGLALVRLGRFGEARTAFSAGRDELAGANPAYRARLGAMAGNAALAGGEAEAALPYFETAITDAQTAGDAKLAAGLSIDRARTLVMLKRNEDAVAALEQARSDDPSNVQAWLLSATLSRRLGRLGEAQRQIQYAATLAPRDPDIGLEAGVIAALSGREDDARRSFASVLEVAPGSDEARRAQSYLDQLGLTDMTAEPEQPGR